MKILFMFGANLNMLGQREAIYGDFSLSELEQTLKKHCESRGITPEFYVSNHEGELIDRIHRLDFDALVINPGAFSHYSLAIADALRCVNAPKIEVHLTNIHARDRHVSVTGAACDGVISGLKVGGYICAIDLLAERLNA